MNEKLILSALGDADSPQREGLVSLLVDVVLDLPASTLIDADDVVDVVSAALTEDNARRVTERWLEPAWERHKVTSREEGDTVGDAVPDPQREVIRRLLSSARAPKAKWAKGAVEPHLVRDLLAPVLQHTLLGFVRKLPGLGGAGDGGGHGHGGPGAIGGLAGAFGKRALERAGKLADMGRGVLGGALDERVQRMAKEFSRGTLGEVRDALRDRLRSAEGRKLVGKIREQVFDRLLEAQVAELMKDVEMVPLADVREVAAALVAYNAERSFVREAVRAQVQAWLELEGQRTIGDLLDEANLREPVRQVAVRRLHPVLQALFDRLEGSDSA